MKETNSKREPLHGTPVIGAEGDDEIDLFELARTIWRGKWWVLGCALLVMVLGGFYVFKVAVPKYQSTTMLSLDVRSQNVVDLESVMSGMSSDQSALNTELKVIKSRGLLGKLVDELSLTDDPEFNGRIREEPAISVGKLKQQIKDALGLTPPPIARPSETVGSEHDDVRNEVIDEINDAISTSNERNTYVFQISVKSQNPYKSALLANTLADLYIANQISVKFDATEKAVAWLSGRVTELEVDLETRENDLKNARSETDLISPEALEALNRQAKDIRERLTDARVREEQAQTRARDLVALAEQGDIAGIAQAASDPTLDRLLTQAQSDEPGQARELFFKRFDLIVSRAEAELERARQQTQALANSLDKLERQSDQQAEDLVKIQQMERELNATRTLYETFLTRLKETTVQRGLQQADSHVLSRAIPGEYVEPKKTRILALCLILGGIIGVGIVLLRHNLHNVFQTAEELEHATGHVVLGQIPQIPIRKRRNLIRYLMDKPTSAASEAIRNLRTSVLLSDIDNPPKVILSTSSIPGEGKTTQSLSLAHNLSGLGKKVLLIEGDIRRRTFTEYFDERPTGGVVTALKGETPLHEIVFHDEQHLNCDVLMGEKTNVSAADVFSSDAFKTFMQRAREAYDFVIIDTPPVLVVPDARVIAQHADAIIYSVAWDRTHRSQVIDGLKEFALVNRPVTGLVLAQVSPRGMKRYGYGGKYGAYARYGDKYYNAG